MLWQQCLALILLVRLGSNEVGAADVAGGSLCEEGQMLPEFMFIGVNKAATSSFAKDLVEAGLKSACGVKECHYFEGVPGKKQNNFRYYPQRAIVSIKFKDKFLKSMPKCPAAEDPKKAVADYTPQYMMYDPDSPLLARELYGEQHRRLKLMVMLRDPVERLESQWTSYAHWFDKFMTSPAMAKMMGLKKGRLPSFLKMQCPMCKGKSFTDDMRSILRSRNPSQNIFFLGSLYSVGLEPWMLAFPMENFVILPFRVFTREGGSKPCEHVAKMLDVKLACPDPKAPSTHINKQTNGLPSNGTADIHDPQVRSDVREYFQPFNEQLYELLAEAHTNGATLFNYKGPKGNAAAVKEWMEANW